MPERRARAVLRFGAALASLAMLAGCGWMAVPPNRAGANAPGGPAVASTPAQAPGTVTVQAGDTVYAVARRSNAPIRAIIEANHLEPPYVLRPGQQLVVPHPQVHVVKAGETLYGIARQHQVDASGIVRANDVKPPYKLLVGQILILPDQVASAPPSTPPAPQSEIQKVELLPPPPAPASSSAPGTVAGTQDAAIPPTSGSSPAPPAGMAPAAGTAAALRVAQEGAASAAPAASPGPASTQTASIEPMAVPLSAPPPAADATEAAPAPDAKLASLPPANQAPTAVAPMTGGNGRFLWPIRGNILSGFGPKESGLYNDGINIAATQGATVIAADDGVVAYAGNEIRGFGNLVLIKHANGWMTAYAHNDALLVKRGDHVRRGQPIAKAGSSGSVATPQVHFEVRHGSHAVDPMKYLGTMSS